MALRRALSLRSLFTARCYNPFDTCGKPNYGSFLHQRPLSGVTDPYVHPISRLSLCTPFGVSICRSMSTSHVPGSDQTANVNDVVGTLADSVLQDLSSQTQVSDSLVHFDVVQQIISNVHSFTGLNWWTSIVLTTLLIRGMTIPLLIYQERWWSRMMMLATHTTTWMDIKNQGGDPAALDKHIMEFHNLVMEYGGYDRLKIIRSPVHYVRSFLQFPVLIYMGLTISDVTEKVGSFRTGGVLWFTDLTSPDALYIFPLLTGLTFWIALECDAMVGLEGVLVTLKKLARFMAIPLVIVGMDLSKAVHCYWISCMLFSIAFRLVICRPGVKKKLRIPHIPEDMAIKLYRRALKKKLGLDWLSRR